MVKRNILFVTQFNNILSMNIYYTKYNLEVIFIIYVCKNSELSFCIMTIKTKRCTCFYD